MGRHVDNAIFSAEEFFRGNKKFVLATIASIVFLIIAVSLFRKSRSPVSTAPPTQADYQQAAKVPQWRCGCWNDTIGQCMPSQLCQKQETFNPMEWGRDAQ